MSADMKKSKKSLNNPEIALDTVSRKPKRGRRGVNPHMVFASVFPYTAHLKASWNEIKEPILKAKSAQEIKAIIESTTNTTLKNQLAGIEDKVYEVVHEKKFPTREKAQIRFLAESLAGCYSVSTRRSRDICAEMRLKEKVQTRIIRKEFYIECTCGYQGPAKYGKCARCGTGEIDPSLEYKEIFNE